MRFFFAGAVFRLIRLRRGHSNVAGFSHLRSGGGARAFLGDAVGLRKLAFTGKPRIPAKRAPETLNPQPESSRGAGGGGGGGLPSWGVRIRIQG